MIGTRSISEIDAFSLSSVITTGLDLCRDQVTVVERSQYAANLQGAIKQYYFLKNQ